jgi:hypothetical protein
MHPPAADRRSCDRTAVACGDLTRSVGHPVHVFDPVVEQCPIAVQFQRSSRCRASHRRSPACSPSSRAKSSCPASPRWPQRHAPAPTRTVCRAPQPRPRDARKPRRTADVTRTARLRRPPDGSHTGVSSATDSNACFASAALSVSQARHWAESVGPGTLLANALLGSVIRSPTSIATTRCVEPTWSTRSASVHFGVVGTGAAASRPCTQSANVFVCSTTAFIYPDVSIAAPASAPPVPAEESSFPCR